MISYGLEMMKTWDEQFNCVNLTANNEQNDRDFSSNFQTLYLYEVIRVKILNHCFIFSLSNKSAESVVWWWNGYALRKYYRKNQSAELADIGFFVQTNIIIIFHWFIVMMSSSLESSHSCLPKLTVFENHLNCLIY